MFLFRSEIKYLWLTKLCWDLQIKHEGNSHNINSRSRDLSVKQHDCSERGIDEVKFVLPLSYESILTRTTA